MGIQDRDWYRMEAKRKQPRWRPHYRLTSRDWFVLGALAATAFWYFAGFLKL